MLDSFYISEFKAFKSATLENLRRVNLIVGSNNAGKSCILEAIRLWSSNGSPSVIRDIIRSHDVDISTFRRKRRSRDEFLELDDLFLEDEAEDPVRFLFHGFHYQTDLDIAISLGPSDIEERLSISLGLYKTTRSEDGVPRRTKVEPAMFSDYDGESELVLEIRPGRSRRFLYPVDTLWLRRGVIRPSSLDELPSRPLTIVGTAGVSSTQVAQLWDRVSLTPDQDRVLECLRLIEPRIEGLTLVSEREAASSSHRIPVVSLRGEGGRFPLKTMGDGVTRLFHIALSMVNARGGLVLLDEFENGLYWEVQDQLWPIIFKFAEEFDVQVFATSHSKDCIGGFLDAVATDRESGALFRVEKTDESVSIDRIPTLNASDALSAGVEIR